AGLRRVRTEPAQYEWSYTLDDYLDGLEVWAVGRFAKEMLGGAAWAGFRGRARTVFGDRFADPVHDRRDVLLAIGIKEKQAASAVPIIRSAVVPSRTVAT